MKNVDEVVDKVIKCASTFDCSECKDFKECRNAGDGRKQIKQELNAMLDELGKKISKEIYTKVFVYTNMTQQGMNTINMCIKQIINEMKGNNTEPQK